MTDYDDPETDAQWCAERREEVADYLRREGVAHGRIAGDPAWHIAPYVSVWSIEGSDSSNAVGLWAVCGDMPSDYVSAAKAKTPREAVEAIATLWQEAAGYMARGQKHPTFQIGSGESDVELAPMLASRAALLLEWVGDAEVWEDEA